MTVNNHRYSFEFFPPKTEKGQSNLLGAAKTLADHCSPDFFSVTYGAGGSTRDGTLLTVNSLIEMGLSVAPHLSFGGDDKQSMVDLLKQYQSKGVKRIVALRGDMPSGMGAVNMVYANELVAFIRKETGNHFHLEVAAYPEVHPESVSASSDINFFKQKVDAGASSAITQYFYNPDAYYDFVSRCQQLGINIPIYPGIMPITNYSNLARFSASCGAEIPRWMRKQFEEFENDTESTQALGEEIVTRLCQQLIDYGSPGLHFYTMNQSNACIKIWDNLGL